MSIYIYFSFVCSRLHLFKSCLCCLVDMHLYSNNLSTIKKIFSSIIQQLLPACVS